MFAGVIFLVDAVQFILFRLVIRAAGGQAQLTKHDREEYRGTATMLIISGIYIVVSLIVPQLLLLVIALGLFGRTVQTHLWRRWGAHHD